jgi:hypothetical protein
MSVGDSQGKLDDRGAKDSVRKTHGCVNERFIGALQNKKGVCVEAGARERPMLVTSQERGFKV